MTAWSAVKINERDPEGELTISREYGVYYRIERGEDGYELYTEKGKTTITFKEMAQYHGNVLPKGDNIQITLKDDNRAELAIGRMVLVVPEAFLLEKGLI